jgi:CBS domain-containing protein
MGVAPAPGASDRRAEWRARLCRHAPFGQMAPASVDALLDAACPVDIAAGQTVFGPGDGVATRLWWIEDGAVSGLPAGARDGGFLLEAGEMFPAAAVLARRPVTSVYRACQPLRGLAFDADTVRRVAATDAVLADFMNRRLQHLLALSVAQTTWAGAGQVLEQQPFESPLSALPRRAPVAVAPGALLHEALSLMHQRRVGSVLALDAQGAAVGILTRGDLLPKIALREPPPDMRRTPVKALMTEPVLTLDIGQSVQEALLLMSRADIRHLPLTENGRVVSIVSEHDLFSLQRRSLRQIGAGLRSAGDVASLRTLAPEVRAWARQLLAQGVAARTLVPLVSHLNDLLTQRLVTLLAADHGLDLTRACWVAFGAEGRGEQTIATDQDNGLVLDDAVDDAEHARWMAMARHANDVLDACGYPLCKGGVMAGQPRCCLRQGEWAGHMRLWMTRCEPEDLLAASTCFDLRPLAGNATLAAPLRALVVDEAPRHTRFLRLLAESLMRLRPALNWHGGVAAEAGDAAQEWVDLKLRGSFVFVGAGRFFALAHGIDATTTRDRLLQAGTALGAAERERQTWAGAFEALQMLRLRAQVQAPGAENPNRLDLRTLDDIDRRLLKEALRVARQLQQRIALDWLR